MPIFPNYKGLAASRSCLAIAVGFLLEVYLSFEGTVQISQNPAAAILGDVASAHTCTQQTHGAYAGASMQTAFLLQKMTFSHGPSGPTVLLDGVCFV